MRVPIAAGATVMLLALAYWSLAREVAPPVRFLDRGLEAERRGDLAGAERDLLEAANLDHQYIPRWTLAGFSFRHNRREDFWKWTRAALDVGTRDLGALFDLCWYSTTDAGEIWTRAIPDRKEIWNEYLAYLIAANRWDAGAGVALRLVERATSTDIPVLTAFTDQCPTPVAAAQVWNELCRRGLIDLPALKSGDYLFNPDWRHKPSGRGLDWRMTPTRDIRETWLAGEIHLSFDGIEPDRAELLNQPLALPPGQIYELRSDALPQNVRWQMEVDGNPVALKFIMPVTGHKAMLKLIYERMPGTPSATGSVVVHPPVLGMVGP